MWGGLEGGGWYVTNRSITGKINLPPKFSRSQFFFFLFHIVFISDSNQPPPVHADPRSHTTLFSYLQRFLIRVPPPHPPRYDTGTAELRRPPPGRADICSAPSTGPQNLPGLQTFSHVPITQGGWGGGGTLHSAPQLRRWAPSRSPPPAKGGSAPSAALPVPLGFPTGTNCPRPPRAALKGKAGGCHRCTHKTRATKAKARRGFPSAFWFFGKVLPLQQ